MAWQPLQIRPSDLNVAANADGLTGYLRTEVGFDALLASHKAVVFRGFGPTEAALSGILDVLLRDRLPYVHGNSPRTKVGDNVYTSTDYPPDLVISMHNEMSYAQHWPARLTFFCAQAPTTGGATPVVDGGLWLEAVGDDIRDAFAAGVCYTQNLHSGYGAGKSWQATFETDNRDTVEAFLASTDAQWRWKPDDSLWIRQTRPATICHPVTGEEVWFNQADQWHPAGLGDETTAALLELMTEDELPQSVTLADGKPIPAEFVSRIQHAGLSHAVDVDWFAGDLMVIDNILVGHGRRPYTGPRRILVAMA